MLSAICAIAIAQTPAYIKPYDPTGPRIEMKMKRGGSFIITTDPKTSPKTVAHILDLVNHKFYDGQRVHRVEYWVTQWGDPQSKTKPMNDPKMGDGDSGHRMPFEMSDVDFVRGIVGIASDGLQNGGDSQLFVIKSNRLYLYHSYAVVGKVTSGMNVVDGIKKGDWITSMRVLPSGRREAFQGTPYRWPGASPELNRQSYENAKKAFRRTPRNREARAAYIAATNRYADTFMFGDFPPKTKYRAALRLYREVLSIDPSNWTAKHSVQTIESIYRQMGKPIPK